MSYFYCYAECRYAECRYAACRYAEGGGTLASSLAPTRVPQTSLKK